MFYLYLVTNLLNGKYYVGWTGNLKNRWYDHKKSAEYGSSTHFARAIRKYGPSAFEQQILALSSNLQEIKRLETLWILVLKSYDYTVGYNSTFGGDGVHPTEEVRIKRRAYWKARGVGNGKGCRVIDLTGKQFGRLTVIKKGPSSSVAGGGNARWYCRCICGNESLVLSVDLRGGHTQSCGCLQKERATGRPRKVLKS